MGEIRDGETASVAIQAAMTGHLVFSTLHTNDAVSAVLRLEDLGVERFKLASALLGVTAQRLVRRLCPACSAPGPVEALPAPIADAMRRLSIEVAHRVAKGCDECGFSGYKTRFALTELLEVTTALRERISSGDSVDAIRSAALGCGALQTLEADAVWHVAHGHTSVDEVLPYIRLGTLSALQPGAAALSPEPTQTPAPSPAVTRRVVVASSDPVWSALVPASLEAAGFDVYVTSSGAEALAAVARSAPLALVVGPQMESLTPGALIGAVRNVMGLVDLPVVAIAASTKDATAAGLAQAGANDVVTPPVDARALAGRVEATIARRSTWSAEWEIARPPVPIDEPARLQALHDTAALDTLPEERIDEITRTAQRRLGVPMALVSLVDAERQWFKSRQGVEAQEMPREISFCGHAINQSDVFVVPDARLDPRFSENPLVSTGPRIRFYAGCPIVSPDGHNVGMMCVMDHVPRNVTEDEKTVLRELARKVQDQMWPQSAAGRAAEELQTRSRARGREHDDDLHARVEPGRAREEEPVWSALTEGGWLRASRSTAYGGRVEQRSIGRPIGPPA